MNYSKTFEVRWADCDPNGHVRNSAYIDYCTHVRLMFLTENGFGVHELLARKMGPVVMHDETDYLKEVRVGDSLKIDLRALAMSKEGGKWKLTHQVFRGDGVLAARHTLFGGWLDLEKRKLAPPPPELLAVMNQLDRVAEFVEL